MTDVQIHKPSLGPYTLEAPNVCLSCGKLLSGVTLDEPCGGVPLSTDYLSACHEFGVAADKIQPRRWAFDRDRQLYILMKIAGHVGFWDAAVHIRDDLLNRGVAVRSKVSGII